MAACPSGFVLSGPRSSSVVWQGLCTVPASPVPIACPSSGFEGLGALGAWGLQDFWGALAARQHFLNFSERVALLSLCCIATLWTLGSVCVGRARASHAWVVGAGCRHPRAVGVWWRWAAWGLAGRGGRSWWPVVVAPLSTRLGCRSGCGDVCPGRGQSSPPGISGRSRAELGKQPAKRWPSAEPARPLPAPIQRALGRVRARGCSRRPHFPSLGSARPRVRLPQPHRARHGRPAASPWVLPMGAGHGDVLCIIPALRRGGLGRLSPLSLVPAWLFPSCPLDVPRVSPGGSRCPRSGCAAPCSPELRDRRRLRSALSPWAAPGQRGVNSN